MSDNELCSHIVGLSTKIRAAFSCDLIPTGRLTTGMSNHPDNEYIERTFQGRQWDNVTPAELRYADTAVLRFTRAALLYYLPAYLLEVILHPHESDLELYVVGVLTDYNTKAEFHALFSELTDSQREVCREFLEHIVDQGSLAIDEIYNALATYW